MDYRKYIGMQVDIKTSSYLHRVQGELVAVYSTVLCVQGLTFWGILVKDIVDFEVIQPLLFASGRSV